MITLRKVVSHLIYNFVSDLLMRLQIFFLYSQSWQNCLEFLQAWCYSIYIACYIKNFWQASTCCSSKTCKRTWKHPGRSVSLQLYAPWVFSRFLTQIWVGFLGVRFEVVGSKTILCLKLVRIILETWNLFCKHAHICSFRKYAF